MHKLHNIFNDSSLVTFLHSVENIEYFEDIAILENGKLVEQGKVLDLIQDDISMLSCAMKFQNIDHYNRISSKYFLIN